MNKLNFHKEIKYIRKEILDLLAHDNFIDKKLCSRFVKLTDKIEKFIYKYLYGTSLEKSFINIQRQRRSRVIGFYISFLRQDNKGHYYFTEGLPQKKKKEREKYFNNALTEILQSYYKWIEKAERKLIGQNLKQVSDLYIADYFLSIDNRIITRRAAGMIVALTLSEFLINLHKKEGIKLPKSDDILPLCDNLREKSRKMKLKAFLNRNYPYFQQASKTRIKCAHIVEGIPSRAEIETMIKKTRELLSLTH